MYDSYSEILTNRRRYPVLRFYSLLLRILGWAFMALGAIGVVISFIDVSRFYNHLYLSQEIKNFYRTVLAVRAVLNLYSSALLIVSGFSFVLMGEAIFVDIALNTAQIVVNTRSLDNVERYTRQLVESLPEPEA